MTHYQPVWDFNLPANSLTTLPDDDFLAILQSQIANPASANEQFFIPQDSTNIPFSANPKSLSRIPHPSNDSPPLSDSSPSPPSGVDNNNNNNNNNNNRNNNSDDTARRQSLPNGWGDDALKRKAHRDDDDDDDDDSPPTQKSHLDDKTLPKAPSRRKNSGNPAADEMRLLKRKEQNRAAQRAFRERKERHVKDLEDQLAEVEARNESTQAENENLREMLRRLQAENTVLKQAAFTFSVPRAPPHNPTVPGSSNISDPSRVTSRSPNTSNKDASGSSSSSNASPNSLFEDSFGEPPLYSAPSSVPTDSPKHPVPGDSMLNPSDDSEFSAQSFYGQSTDWMSGQPGLPNHSFQSPFTIISSNPTYMSYRDPNPSVAPFAFINPAPPSQSYSESTNITPMHSFSPHQQQAYQNFLSPDVVMSDFTAGSSPTDLGSYTFSPTAATKDPDTSALADLFGINGGAILSPFSVGTSPVSHLGSSGKPSPVSHSDTLEFKSTRCPKDQISQMIASKGASPFVSPSSSNENAGLLLEGSHLKFDGKPLPNIEPHEANIDAASAFQSLQQHPQFKDCDINGLCIEFATKARCDGTRAVIPPNSMQELVESMPIRAQRS